jgi:hypothetical protein
MYILFKEKVFVKISATRQIAFVEADEIML